MSFSSITHIPAHSHDQPSSPFPEPTPVELIDKFLAINTDAVQPDFFLNPETNALEPVIGDKPYDVKLGRKQIALKILSINMASHLRWDLNSIEKNWNLQKQIQLLEDLCTITSGKGITIPMKKAPALSPLLGNKMAFDFALFVYHRWILRVYKVFKDLIAKKKAVAEQQQQIQQQPNLVPGQQPELNLSLRDEMFCQVMDPEPQASVEYLINLCGSVEQKRMPILTATSIVPLTTNSEPSGKGFRFEKTISAVELRAQTYFDLCQYFLYNNAHELAKKFVILCRHNFNLLQAEYKQRGVAAYLICDIDEAELNGVLLACGASAVPDSLMQRFNNFVMNRGDDLINILRADNVAREIPFVQRKIIELDMEATALINPTKTKDEILKSIVALNTIRSVVGPETVMSGSDFLGLYRTDEDYSYFSIFIQHHLKSSGEVKELERQLLTDYLLQAVTLRDTITPALAATLKKMDLIAEVKISELKNKKTAAIALPEIALQTEWVVPETNRKGLINRNSALTYFNQTPFSSLGSRPAHRAQPDHQHQHGQFQTTTGRTGGRRLHRALMACQSQLVDSGPVEEHLGLVESGLHPGLFLLIAGQGTRGRLPPRLLDRRAHVVRPAHRNATARVREEQPDRQAERAGALGDPARADRTGDQRVAEEGGRPTRTGRPLQAVSRVGRTERGRSDAAHQSARLLRVLPTQRQRLDHVHVARETESGAAAGH